VKAARVKQGSVVWNKRFKTWNFLWIQDGRRRSKVIGTLRDFPTKEGATRAAEALRHALDQPGDGSVPTVCFLVREFRREKMPERFSTRLGYEAWLKNHILPRWGGCIVTALQARPVELWLNTLPVSPKSRVHVRALIRALWEYAMWRADIPTQRNPMELVTVKNGTKRRRQPRSLTVEEFQRFVGELEEPVRTIALVCVCFGCGLASASRSSGRMSIG
jgi:integrase